MEGEEADMEPGSPPQPELLTGTAYWANAVVCRATPEVKARAWFWWSLRESQAGLQCLDFLGASDLWWDAVGFMAFLSRNQPCTDWHLWAGAWVGAGQTSSWPLSQGLLPGSLQLWC